MATAHPLPASAGIPHPAGAPHPGAATPARAAAGETIQALVPVPPPQGQEEPVFSAPIPQLPVELGVTIPVRDFRVRQLLALAPGQVIETQWSHGDDLPLAAGDVQLAWSEFEVVETRLAVRVTRLA
ncbi:MAG TPA: FliM/FliN family flagellar motor C-terminal domain-containing protein [Terracidiphilus sp.]|nr:FliM/FliN family flagellar motor C-terminal domain-containing protein [Terracidiphilus sp.]